MRPATTRPRSEVSISGACPRRGNLCWRGLLCKVRILLPGGVTLDHSCNTPAVSLDVHILRVGRPGIGSVNDTVPRFGVARRIRNCVTMLRVICAGAEPSDYAEAYQSSDCVIIV